MTDYSVNRRQRWKQEKFKRQGKTFLAFVIVILLLFASVNGLLRSFSFKKNLDAAKWDGKVPFVSILSTKPVSIFVYNPDNKTINFLKLPENLYFETGDMNQPLIKLSDVVSAVDGARLAKTVSMNVGAKIDNFIFPGKDIVLDNNGVQSFFKDFASPIQPILILTKGAFAGAKTNIERFDAIRLWWQIKGLSINQLKIVNLGDLHQEVLTGRDSKVLGVDTENLQYKISQYLESRLLKESGYRVKIVNSSGDSEAGILAASFVRSTGLEVVSVEKGDTKTAKSSLVAVNKTDFVPVYLARVFSCDIFTRQKNDQTGESASEKELTLIVGGDFADLYFR